MNLNWSEQFALIECAARVLADQKPSQGGCSYLRSPAVKALRAMWKNGDEGTRLTIIARVSLWLDRPKADWMRVYVRNGGKAA